jgi:hypothetical protein
MPLDWVGGISWSKLCRLGIQPRDERGQRAQDMFMEFGHCRRGVSYSDGCEQFGMSRRDFRESGGAGVVLHDRDAKLRANRLVDSNQKGIPGEFAQRLVEPNILLHDLRQIVGQAWFIALTTSSKSRSLCADSRLSSRTTASSSNAQRIWYRCVASAAVISATTGP